MFHPVRAASRAMLAGVFIGAGIHHVKAPEGFATDATEKLLKTAGLAGNSSVPSPKLLVQVDGGLMVAAGAALALGLCPKIAAATLAGALVPTTLAGHAFWEETDPMAKMGQQTQFMKNTALIGGLLAVVASKN